MAEGIDIVRVHAQADFVTLNALFDHPAICTSELACRLLAGVQSFED